ncbi:Serine/threonine-protein phosphatase [Trichostrongylus colubriformis]|uniref:Serine/threonine-protein phosphatase n=1 Tax=Trichostrongylus colubriformis TaxID=6319 RepID=A0AAN8ET39_TRICO
MSQAGGTGGTVDYSAFLKRHLKMSNVLNDRHIKYTADELKDVIKCSMELLKQEGTLAEINPPIVIVGDIHGQYFDLLRMFSKFSEGNQHGSMRVKYIFLGDYVDRGRRSLECVCLVLTLKILFPRKYQLLRGNHECKGINRVYGFYDELLDRFEKDEAERLWFGFNEVFAWLPLAGLVGKKILCMHGGISAYLNSLEDIRKIQRPMDEPNNNPLAMDLLWADPMLNIQGYAPNTVRGVATFFGEDTVIQCCEKLHVDLIVRAHQMMMSGYGFFCNRKLITIFTAPRYQPEANNKGAVVYVDKQGKIGFKVLSPLEQAPPDAAQNDEAPTKVAGPDDKSFRVRRGQHNISASARMGVLNQPK